MQLNVPHSPAPPVWFSSVHPGILHASSSQLPRTVPEQAGKEGHLTTDGFAVAPLLCPQARTHTQIFGKKIKCVPLLQPGQRPRAQQRKKAKIIKSFINTCCATERLVYLHRSAPFRSIFNTGIRAVHGSGNSPTEMAGHPPGHLSGRLAAAGTIGAGGQSAHAYSHTAPI